ncbi:MAG: hypothetical protein ABWY25_06500 [Paenisporosarcina sp.]
MLKIVVLGTEYFNEETEEFQTVGDFELELEHSLISLSKWESKHQKPFLTEKSKTPDEVFSYIESMILTPIYPDDILGRFDQRNMSQINDYIESKESATTFGEMPTRRGRGEIITSELIYYWMVAFNIPFECERWHLNRLFALIRICNIKNSKPRKMSRTEMAARNRELNAKRKAEYNTSG